MANYTTEFDGISWGQVGIAPPPGYSYTDDIPPIEEYDDWFNYHSIETLKHLVTLTNARLESSSGTARPTSPEDGQLFWDSDDGVLEIYDSGFGAWRRISLNENVANHIGSTSNPHNVTAAQAGAIPDENGTVTQAHLSFNTATQSELNSHTNDSTNPHNVTAAQAGAAPASHNHDGRYYTESEINNLLSNKSNVGHSHSEVNGYKITVSGNPPSNPNVNDLWFKK
jgi:hypothetical protein